MVEWSDVWRFLKNYGLYICIFVLWFLFRDNPEPNQIIKTQVSMLAWLGVALIYVGKTEYLRMQYDSPQVVCQGDNLHGSCVREPVVIGTWSVFEVGKVRLPDEMGISPDKLFICPYKCVEKCSENFVIHARLERTPVMMLPEELILYCESSKCDKNEFYFGVNSEYFEKADPNKALQLVNARHTQLVHTNMDGLLRNKQEVVEDNIASTARAMKKFQGNNGIVQKVSQNYEEQNQ